MIKNFCFEKCILIAGENTILQRQSLYVTRYNKKELGFEKEEGWRERERGP